MREQFAATHRLSEALAESYCPSLLNGGVAALHRFVERLLSALLPGQHRSSFLVLDSRSGQVTARTPARVFRRLLPIICMIGCSRRGLSRKNLRLGRGHRPPS